MYCSNCGTKLNDDAKFCSKCGFSLAAPLIDEKKPEKTMTPSNQSNDKSLMVLNVNKKEGLLKTSNTFLVFFRDRIVFAELTTDRQKSESKILQQKIKDEGIGFFKGSAEMMSYWSNYGNKYYELNSYDILKEENNNFDITNDEIEQIIFKPGDNSLDNSSRNVEVGKIEIISNKSKITATHKYYDSNHNIKKVLENLYGKKLKYKNRSFTIKIGGKKEGFI